MNRLTSLVILAALASACGNGSAPARHEERAASASEALEWTHYSSDITEDGHPAVVKYWVRGAEVVRQYWQDGVLLYDERCEGKRASVREMLPAGIDGKPAFNYKEVSDREDAEACFAAATHDELRYLRHPESLPVPERITLPDGRRGLRWVGPTGHQRIVDEKSSLPIRIDYGSAESGGIATIGFAEFSRDRVPAPPAAPEVEWTGFQETFDVPVSEAGRALHLDDVPAAIDGLTLRRAWSFRTQNLAKPSYYLIWGGDDKNLQMITTFATLPEDRRGFSEDGTEYDAQEGERHVKIGTIGGDARLVRSAIAVLRPGYSNDPTVHRDAPDALAPIEQSH
jgi:hypothetical protein